MHEVMNKAQALAEAILASGLYQKMQDLDAKLQSDPEASAAMSNLMEKRQKVQDILQDPNMDPAELAAAGAEVQAAEEAMSSIQLIIDARKASSDYQEMMNNVNRILRLVITGEVVEEENAGGCTGNCAHCQGCH